MPKSRRDKTTGLPIPSPVVPATSICFSIQIPDAIEYKSAFKGALANLGQAWTWAQTEGQDNQASFDAAELWRTRINEAFYSLECGSEPVSCLDVANCVETSYETQQAIQAIVPYTPIDGYTYPPGVPLTPGQMVSRLNEIDTCTFDAYWAQCEQFIDFMVNLGQDVLDQLALYSAALDAGENVPMGQFLGKLKNSSTAGKVIEFLQWVLVTVKAQYEAADNAANRDALKCAVFCAGKDDCLITIQGTLDVLNARLGGLLVPSDLDDLPAMVTAFTTAVFNPALALDLWILFLMGSAQTAGMFGLENIDETLNMVLAVAVNDANNDWETKCEECDEPPPDPNCVDFTETQGTYSIVSGNGSYETGQGFKGLYYAGFNSTALWVNRAPGSGTITKIVVNYNEPVTQTQLLNTPSSPTLTYSGSPVSQIEFSIDTFPTWVNRDGGYAIALRVSLPTNRSTLRMTSVCVYLA